MNDLDRKLAEGIMKWTPYRRDKVPKWLNYWNDERTGITVPISEWKPSEKIEQAFVVVEKLFVDEGYRLALQMTYREGRFGWLASFGASSEVFADTPAMAICGACDKTLGAA